MDFCESIIKQTHVSLSLTSHVSSIEAPNKNLVFSPLSLHVVLSMIASGSTGPTRDQLLKFLKSESSDDLNKLSSEIVSIVFEDGASSGGPKLRFANGVWVDQTLPLKPGFKNVVDHFYKAAFNQVDFIENAVQVTSDVNAWAEKETGGLIKELLPSGSVDSLTRLIFANAIYFKGAWKHRFDARKTADNDFHLLNGSSVKVPFMTSNKNQFIRCFDGFKVLGLDYEQGKDYKRQFSMYFLLPDVNNGLPSLVEKLSSQSDFVTDIFSISHLLIDFLNQHLPYEKVEVGDLRIPKFRISFGFEASKVMKGLGVELQPFIEGGLLEMTDSSSPMARNDHLYVSNIFQKSFIEVSEEGTEAAAASAAVVAVKSLEMSSVKVDFVADHPFMFIIREDVTGTVVFTGQIMNPLEE